MQPQRIARPDCRAPQWREAMDNHEKHEHPVEIILDGTPRGSPTNRLNGLQIRELGPADRVNGFETQEINKEGKKIRTIPDNETITLHDGERFRTVPNHGGPGRQCSTIS
jgi:hypothetical protein